MCLTKPVKIISIKRRMARVKDNHENEREIVIAAVPEVKVGDWVMVSANLAVQKISEEEAVEILALIR